MRTVVLAFFLALASCTKQAPPASTPAAENEIAKTFERGPLKATLRLTPKEPALIDPIRLDIEAEIEKGYTLTLPQFSEGLGDFIVRDYHSDAPETNGEKVLYRAHYELEVFVSGEFKVRPMLFTFVEAPKAAATPENAKEPSAVPVPAPIPEEPVVATEEKIYKLATEDLAITVKPLADEASRGELASPAGPEEMPTPPQTMAYYIAAGAVLAIALGAALFFVLRSRLKRVFVAPPTPPHERAFRELRALLDEELIAKGRVKEFFFRLTFIIRTYVEQRYGLHAPEQTTEEFLPSAANSGLLSPAHQKLLETFLSYADLVKYAKLAPGAKDIENSFGAARTFINETAPAPAQGGANVSA